VFTFSWCKEKAKLLDMLRIFFSLENRFAECNSKNKKKIQTLPSAGQGALGKEFLENK